VTRPPPLYTREFAFACGLHLAGATSLAFFPLFPLYVKAIGGTETTIGLLLGVGAAASVVARPGVGVLLDRLGRRRVLLAGNLANAASWIPFLFVTAPGPWLYVWTTLHDVVWGALFASYFTYAADLIPAERRAEGIAVFGVAGMTANGLAPVLGEIVIARAGFPAYFGTAIVFALVAVAMTLGVADRPAAAAAPSQTGIVKGLVALGRSPELRRVFVASAFLGAAINAAFFFVAPFTRELGLARSGPFFMAYAGTSIVIRLFGRRALDLMGPHRVSVPGFTIFAIGLAGLALLPYVGVETATAVLVATGIAGGAGHGSLFPVLSALAIARAPASMQGAVVSLHTAALDLGAVLGTPLCGAVADRAGYPAMYVMMGICCWAGLILMVTDPIRGRRGGGRW
jgi:predicted MFS family arabinose efflux permease